MSNHSHTTIRNPTSRWPPAPFDGPEPPLRLGRGPAGRPVAADRGGPGRAAGQLGWVVGEVGPAASPGIQATARRLEAAESRRAARLLARKHPLLHGVLVPLTHRLGRGQDRQDGPFQLTPSTMAMCADHPRTP